MKNTHNLRYLLIFDQYVSRFGELSDTLPPKQFAGIVYRFLLQKRLEFENFAS